MPQRPTLGWFAASDQNIQAAHAAQPENHAEPERRIVENPAATNQGAPLDGHDRQLQHHSDKPVTSQLLRDAPHDQLMTQRTDQECNRHGDGGGKICF